MFQKSALPPTSSGKNKKTEEKADNQSDFVKRDLTMVSRPSLAATISSLAFSGSFIPRDQMKQFSNLQVSLTSSKEKNRVLLRTTCHT
jgi:hypothetical protein